MQERYHGIRDSTFQRRTRTKSTLVEPALVGIWLGVVISSFMPRTLELTFLSDYAPMGAIGNDVSDWSR